MHVLLFVVTGSKIIIKYQPSVQRLKIEDGRRDTTESLMKDIMLCVLYLELWVVDVYCMIIMYWVHAHNI